MDNQKIADEITSVIWRVSPKDLEDVLDVLTPQEVDETVDGFTHGVDFFATPAGKRFYKNGKVKTTGKRG